MSATINTSLIEMRDKETSHAVGQHRSYVMKDGHLFLSLKLDGGICEFEPIKGKDGK
jgi:hypothetical protein